MGNRITKVYTRTGDDGSTGLADGTRVDKDSSLIHAMGDIDELNAAIGLLRAEALPDAINLVLLEIQNELFSIGGELAMPEYQIISTQHIKQLESTIDRYNKTLPPLKEFILPAGDRVIAQCHVIRTIGRRAERSLVAQSKVVTLRPELLGYVNRLSDLLFVLARYLGKERGIEEVCWRQ